MEKIADRARQLAGSMTHGQACFSAAAEMGIAEDDLAATASILSMMLTQNEINSSAKYPGLPRTLANLAKGQGKLARRARRMMRQGYSPDETATF